MRKHISYIFAFCCAGLFTAVAQAQNFAKDTASLNYNEFIAMKKLTASDTLTLSINDSVITQQWNKLVAPGLQTPLWAAGNAYNAGHFYMLPLQAAFQFQQATWQQQFAGHFKNFVTDGRFEAEPVKLYRLQYYYLASWYLLLAAKQQYDTATCQQLFSIIYDEIDNTWNYEPASVWKHPDLQTTSFENMRSLLLWKLYNVQLPDKIYHRAITDAEKYTLAIAANLKAYLIHTEADTFPKNQTLNDILDFAYIVFNRRVEWNEAGGWLLQPGYWTQHDDYKYAGFFHKENPQPLPVDDISEDVSHSHRNALWLQSFIEASANDTSLQAFYGKLLQGLEKQFFLFALQEPSDVADTYLTFNYMNGWNGLYRWNYPKAAPNTGFGAYELSGTLLLGWWTFLGSERIKEMYKDLSYRFPIPDNILAIYQKRTNDTPIKSDTLWYINGWAELNTKLAAVIR